VFDVGDLRIPPRPQASEVFKSASTSPRDEGTSEDAPSRDEGNGLVFTVAPTPVNGENTSNSLTAMQPFYFGYPVFPTPTGQLPVNHVVPLMEFPEFDGTSPKVWVRNAETYFELYFVPNKLKSRVASMKFTGNAKFWTQSLESLVHQYP
jgi:hypothetical protein